MTNQPKRVMIIGSAGSGKSTLARLLAERLSVPAYHMDREVFWLPGWVEREHDDQVAQIERIAALDEWVFEGNKSSTFSIREARADLLIWLDVPLWKRLWRVTRRAIVQNGQTRDDMAGGCNERLTMLPGFWWFVLSTAASSRRKQQAFFEKTDLPKSRLSTLQDVETLLESYRA
ncbi:MAG: AAA family ATPase [Pseudomonadota bacterium]|nr:AAA family ATPase [Pseudomonadota bacterium]